MTDYTDEDQFAQQLEAISMNQGIDSRQAAALILSDGRTDKVEEAEIMVSAPSIELEELQKAHLRRQMGFDFVIKLRGSRILVISKEGPHVIARAHVKDGEVDDYGNIISEALIDRLVKACIRLKLKWDAEVMREEANKKKGRK